MSTLPSEDSAAGNPGAPAELHTERIAVSRTTKTLSQLEDGVAHYPEPILTEVRFLQGFFLDHCRANISSLRAIAAKLSTDWDKSPEFFHNLVGGYYFTSKTSTWVKNGRAWNELINMVASIRRYAAQVERAGKMPFIQTPTYHCIADFITAKRAPDAICRIGGIVASTGSQTSECFKFYRTLNNHGRVIHLEAPANGRPVALQCKVAEQYSARGAKMNRGTEREQVLRDEVNETRCIIIDNCQVLIDPRRGDYQPCFDWIREIYDDRHPTIILKFTIESYKDLTSGSTKGYFEQFIGRMGGLKSLLRLPDFAPDSDLRVIANAFGLDPGTGAMEYLHEWSRSLGRIRIVFDRLKLAQTFCQADGRKRITLADLEEAKNYEPPATRQEETEDES